MALQTNVIPSKILLKFYISHTLSVWNSRTFEFAVVLFLLTLTPSTLLYSSAYALLRAFTAAACSSRIGAHVDRQNRLSVLRASIIWARIAVILSCAVFAVLLVLDARDWIFVIGFSALVVFAGIEKCAALANAVAVERDWVVVVAEETETDRATLNSVVRRIDLFAKLLAPVFVSAVQAYSTVVAVLSVLGVGLVSMVVEYLAIAQVYQAVPSLAKKSQESGFSGDDASSSSGLGTKSISTKKLRATASNLVSPWIAYVKSPVLLPSLALSLLYLTVLSTGVQYQAYMLSIGFSGLTVSLLRFVAVISELAATCLAPLLMHKIGRIRSGLWSINFQVVVLLIAVTAFVSTQDTSKLPGLILTAGIALSRVGLFGFDLAVQDIVQEVRFERLLQVLCS